MIIIPGSVCLDRSPHDEFFALHPVELRTCLTCLRIPPSQSVDWLYGCCRMVSSALTQCAVCHTLCYAVPCRAVPCRAAPCRAVPFRAVRRYAAPCCAIHSLYQGSTVLRPISLSRLSLLRFVDSTSPGYSL